MRLLIAIGLLFASVLSFGQGPDTRRRLAFGVIGGMNISFHTYTTPDPYPSFLPRSNPLPQVGYEAALAFDYSLGTRWSLNSLLGVTVNRLSWESGSPQRILNLQEKQLWVKMPLTISYVLNPRSKYRFSLGAGTNVRALLSSESKATLLWQSQYTVSPAMDVTKYRHEWVWFAIASAMVETKIGERNRLGFAMDFESGLTPIVDPPDPDPDGAYGWSMGDTRLNPLTFRFYFLF